MRPYVSIDLETTGLDPSYCQILEMGAVIDDWESPIEKLPTFHCYVVHDRIVGQPYALQMNQKILYDIAEMKTPNNFIEPENVGIHFYRWLTLNNISFVQRNVLPAGKNFDAFDRQFLNRLPNFSDDIVFTHRSLDPGMLYFDPYTDDGPPSMQTCLERAGLEPTVTHRAVNDAMDVVKLIRYKFLPNTNIKWNE